MGIVRINVHTHEKEDTPMDCATEFRYICEGCVRILEAEGEVPNTARIAYVVLVPNKRASESGVAPIIAGLIRG